MAGIYNIPPDTREKEKIIGGIMDISQFLWFVAGIGGALMVIVMCFSFLSFFSIILGLPLFVFGCIFAFKKVDGIPYPTYLKLKKRYNKQIKYRINAGFQRDFEFTPVDVERRIR